MASYSKLDGGISSGPLNAFFHSEMRVMSDGTSTLRVTPISLRRMSFTSPSESPWSKMTKRPPSNPKRLASSPRKRTPSEWNVLSHTRSVRSRPMSGTMRSAISRAALLVKVTPRMLSGRAPRSISRAMRVVITRVFPEPAPANTSMGPWSCSTAARCAGLRLMPGV